MSTPLNQIPLFRKYFDDEPCEFLGILVELHTNADTGKFRFGKDAEILDRSELTENFLGSCGIVVPCTAGLGILNIVGRQNIIEVVVLISSAVYFSKHSESRIIQIAVAEKLGKS